VSGLPFKSHYIGPSGLSCSSERFDGTPRGSESSLIFCRCGATRSSFHQNFHHAFFTGGGTNDKASTMKSLASSTELRRLAKGLTRPVSSVSWAMFVAPITPSAVVTTSACPVSVRTSIQLVPCSFVVCLTLAVGNRSRINETNSLVGKFSDHMCVTAPNDRSSATGSLNNCILLPSYWRLEVLSRPWQE
jgi:hypothetical protein